VLVIYYHNPFSLTVPNDVRAMRNIELSLQIGAACTPHARYDKEKVEDHVQEIRRILNTLHASSSSLREGSSADERAPHLTFVDSCNSAASSVSESGTSRPLPLLAFCGMLINPPCSLDDNTTAYGRLISRAFALHELPSLTVPILSSTGESGGIRCLSMGDAQRLVDTMDEARSISAFHHKLSG